MTVRILTGDCRSILKTLPDCSVHCAVTSPPYFGLRDYGVAGQIGLEPTPTAFVEEMVAVFREVQRVLRDDGTLWLNLGDSYSAGGNGPGQCKQRTNAGSNMPPKRVAGFQAKQLLGIPWRVAFALQADGWYLRSDIIWHKPNPMPESITDRPTSAHEHVFLLAKSERYFFDAVSVKEYALCGDKGSSFVDERDLVRHPDRGRNRPSVAKGGFAGKTADADQPAFRAVVSRRNIRNVWTIATQPFREAHFATFPPALIEPCIKAGSPAGGTVLDPFFGAGTTALVADRLGRDCIGIELNPEYAAMARRRLERDGGMFARFAEAAE